MEFKVGDRVEYLGGSGYEVDDCLEKGERYTITNIYIDNRIRTGGAYSHCNSCFKLANKEGSTNPIIMSHRLTTKKYWDLVKDIGWGEGSPVNDWLNNTKENKMKKSISENYDKTADTLLVEKHMGRDICEITSGCENFILQLIVSDHKEAILKEAKRKEEEAKESKQD